MKTITVKSTFRTVKDETSSRYGTKRNPLNWEFAGYEPEDMSTMDGSTLAKVAIVLNDALEKFGKAQLIKNLDDWYFSPNGETVTLDKLVEDILAETTRTRVVTKVTLAAAAKVYAKHAHLIGKLPASATAGAKVIEGKLALISGNQDALSNMHTSLASFIASIPEKLEAVEDLEAFEESLPVFEALMLECNDLVSKLGDSDIAASL